MAAPSGPRPDHYAVLAALPRAIPGPAAAVRPGVLVKVTGAARPGPDGLLTAPLSGLPCVWFRVLEFPVPPDSAPHPLGLAPGLESDGDVPGIVPTRDERSRRPFVLQDASGTVTVDPDLVDTAVQPVDARHGDLAHGYTVTCEWIVPPDCPLVVCGVADPSGVLRDGPGAPLIASTRSENALFNRSVQTVAAASTVLQRRSYTQVRLWLAAAGLAFCALLLVLRHVLS